MNRRSVGRYRGQRDIDYEQAGRELGARYLVMGSLREIEGRLRVLASLVDTKDGAVRWSGEFDRGASDLGLLRNEIAIAVGDKLSTTLGESLPATRPALSSGRSANPETYRLYLLAQHALDRRTEHSSHDRHVPARCGARYELRRRVLGTEPRRGAVTVPQGASGPRDRAGSQANG